MADSRDVDILGQPFEMSIVDGGVLFVSRGMKDGFYERIMCTYERCMWRFCQEESTTPGGLPFYTFTEIHKHLKEFVFDDFSPGPLAFKK